MISSLEKTQKILEELKEFIGECGFSSILLKQGDTYPMDTLLIQLEEGEKEGEENSMVCNLLPIPDEEVEFTEYMHCYLQVPFNLKDMDAGDILKCINKMNQYTLLGHFAYVEEQEAAYVVYRASVPFASKKGMDLVAFCESLFVMRNYEKCMEDLLLKLRETGSADEVLTYLALLSKQKKL